MSYCATQQRTDRTTKKDAAEVLEGSVVYCSNLKTQTLGSVFCQEELNLLVSSRELIGLVNIACPAPLWSGSYRVV